MRRIWYVGTRGASVMRGDVKRLKKILSKRADVSQRNGKMAKNILATVGIVAIVAIIAVWQFGFFADKAKDVSKQVERATASARIEKSIANLKSEIDGLDEKARKYRVEARTYELALEREQAAINELKSAAKKLGSVAKAAGLPKPSESRELSEEQKAIQLTFGSKNISGTEVYSILERWTIDLKQKEEIAEQKRKTIEGMRAVVDKIQERKGEMSLELAEMTSRVKELVAAKDVAKLNAILAEMEASVGGMVVGKTGEAMNVIQEEIDELTATADSYQTEAQTKKSELNPGDILSSDESKVDLDEFWE